MSVHFTDEIQAELQRLLLHQLRDPDWIVRHLRDTFPETEITREELKTRVAQIESGWVEFLGEMDPTRRRELYAMLFAMAQARYFRLSLHSWEDGSERLKAIKEMRAESQHMAELLKLTELEIAGPRGENERTMDAELQSLHQEQTTDEFDRRELPPLMVADRYLEGLQRATAGAD